MPKATRNGGRRGPDLLAVMLLGLLAVAALSAVYGVVAAGYMTTGALLGLIAVGGAFVLVHNMGGRRPAPPKNTLVHGAARPASEQEAQRAARGEAQGPRLDDRDF